MRRIFERGDKSVERIGGACGGLEVQEDWSFGPLHGVRVGKREQIRKSRNPPAAQAQARGKTESTSG